MSPAASSPTPDRNEEFIFDSHCRPRKYSPGTFEMPLWWTASPWLSLLLKLLLKLRHLPPLQCQRKKSFN